MELADVRVHLCVGVCGCAGVRVRWEKTTKNRFGFELKQKACDFEEEQKVDWNMSVKGERKGYR